MQSLNGSKARERLRRRGSNPEGSLKRLAEKTFSVLLGLIALMCVVALLSACASTTMSQTDSLNQARLSGFQEAKASLKVGESDLADPAVLVAEPDPDTSMCAVSPGPEWVCRSELDWLEAEHRKVVEAFEEAGRQVNVLRFAIWEFWLSEAGEIEE